MGKFKIALFVSASFVATQALADGWTGYAYRNIGKNPTGWSRQWCAKFVNQALASAGKRGCSGNTAISCLSAGERLPGPVPGALAVMKSHVGFVLTSSANSISIISGNHSGRSGSRSVGIGNYRKSRVIAYIWPN